MLETLGNLGDFLGVRGSMVVTKTGEITVQAEEVVFLGKTLAVSCQGDRPPRCRRRFTNSGFPVDFAPYVLVDDPDCGFVHGSQIQCLCLPGN